MSATDDKGGILPSCVPEKVAALEPTQRPHTRVRSIVRGFLVLTACLYIFDASLHIYNRLDAAYFQWIAANTHLCPQASPITPEKHAVLYGNLDEVYGSDKFFHTAVDSLAGAVRIPTQTYDDMGAVGEDPRWEAFAPLHEYFAQTFPKVYSNLEVVKVNTYGLVYVWEGSDESLKPLLLTGHQDVVPVNPETYDEWEHPPFSGYFDGKLIWGRGSRDDKSGIVGILTTIELLLDHGFKPARKVVLAFGFDEEASGKYGASSLGKYLEERFGENSFALLVDEGIGILNQYGATFALPSAAEKGYVDVNVQVTAPGGHSSVPPEHTTIGILSQLLVDYENHPFEFTLKRDTPVYWHAECLAEYAPALPAKIRNAMKKAGHSDKHLRKAQEELFKDPSFRVLSGTSQALTIVNGGVKANALPENVMALVNHRIATDSSVAEVQEHVTETLKDTAARFNLSFTAFGRSVTGEEPGAGKLTLSNAWGTALEPAPVSPVGVDDAPYQLLSGSIRATWNAHRATEGDDVEEVNVIPTIVSGNTDTRYYWNLTPHIFRYSHYHAPGNGMSGIHTVNEACIADSYIEMIRFFTTLILNVDESTAL